MKRRAQVQALIDRAGELDADARAEERRILFAPRGGRLLTTTDLKPAAALRHRADACVRYANRLIDEVT